MTVREAHLKDVPAVVEMWKAFMSEHNEIVFKENPRIKPYFQKYLKQKDNAITLFQEFIADNIRSDGALVLIAEVEGEPVGFCLTLIQETIPIHIIEKIGNISDIFVRKEFRGRRLSSQLTKDALKWLENKGVNHVAVTVAAQNKHAYQIYKKWGFMDFQIMMRREI